ncbi:MAG: hypothetical protein ABI861_04850, partial [Panacibacter sp.]
DYLGVVKNDLLQVNIPFYKTGSTGSRLLTGNYELIEDTEKEIAVFLCHSDVTCFYVVLSV